MTLKSVEAVLKLYATNPHLEGGFGEPFGKGLKAMDKYQNQASLAAFRYVFPSSQKNIQKTVHGGALATLVDVATTIGILRLTPLRTISISLNNDFLSVIKVGEEVEIQSEVLKIGKKLVFTDCRIYTLNEKKVLACKGTHTKAIMADNWTFME